LDILQEQVQYYRDRAPEYDQWFFRQGRYDRGAAHRQQWLAEVTQVEAALRAAQPAGGILELACGTGLWTRHLAPLAAHLTAVDASPEVIAINRQRVGSVAVEYVIADLFHWQPERLYDFIFFGFWLSHVPKDKFAGFWHMVKSALKPRGRVFFVDSLLNQASTAEDHAPLHQQGYSERKLDDGRLYRVIKLFYQPAQLQELLQNLGWKSEIHQTENYFLYGSAQFP
jgi:2-polyprenyl-3-methyl-5-hydroxy-6-metoxy-1,4-benzoquinol methylase